MSTLISSMATAGIVSTLAAPTVPVLAAARVTGTTYQLFPALTDGGRQQRTIVNPNAAGSIWATYQDGVTPVANGEGSFEIAPGGRWADSVNNQVRAIFTANAMTITHGER